ncbi:MAG: sigma factor-like helix-turn-helix DNA-binding protein [Candidatus Omnitrophota bacterium]
MAYQWDDSSLRSAVELHQRKVFALAVHLIGGDKDKAYDIASGVFVDTLRASFPLDTDNSLLIGLIRRTIEKCRDVKVVPSLDDSGFEGLSAEKRGSLRMIRASLQSLPFEVRTLLLLRDQVHLPYKHISSVLGISENDARIQTTQARVKLRKAVEEVIAHGR